MRKEKQKKSGKRHTRLATEWKTALEEAHKEGMTQQQIEALQPSLFVQELKTSELALREKILSCKLCGGAHDDCLISFPMLGDSDLVPSLEDLEKIPQVGKDLAEMSKLLGIPNHRSDLDNEFVTFRDHDVEVHTPRCPNEVTGLQSSIKLPEFFPISGELHFQLHVLLPGEVVHQSKWKLQFNPPE